LIVSELFFYGTLRHIPLLELILGRTTLDPIAAELPGYGVFDVPDQPFPVLKAAPGAVANGILVRGLGPEDLKRLQFYEGGFSYDLHPLQVTPKGGPEVTAQVLVPEPGAWPVGAPWSLTAWEGKWGAINQRAATEVMAHYGHLTADEIATRFPGIRIRAAAWVAAQQRPKDPNHDLTRDVVVHAHHRPYSNFFAAEEMDLQYRRYDGQLSPVLNRGAQVLGQAVVVLPYDPVADAVLLVEQFRAPVFIGGDPAPWVWEPVSGMIDPGETPEVAAHRETREEAGVHLTYLDRAGGTYSSTGASSEFVHLYVGLADFSDRQTGGGLDGEGEDIRVGVTPFDELMRGVDQGRYRDMPLVAVALWLARHRERLRTVA
jgi:ADP-ribose diphosphatase